WILQEEKSLALGHWWQPEPDIAVMRGRWDDYRGRMPRGKDLAMVIEVADVSYPNDRGVKWRRYAAAGIPIYWIVNLPARQIEVYTDPTGRGMVGKYRDCTTYGPDAEVPVVIDGREVGRIAVRDVLP